MKISLNFPSEVKIDQVINDLNEGRKSRPHNSDIEITGYWKHHLSQISIEKIGQTNACVTGESGFYFPGATYSGSDLLNTLFKRFTLMRWIGGTKYDLSIPQNRFHKFGYKILGKWISYDFLRSVHHAHEIVLNSEKAGVNLPEKLRLMEIGSGTGIQALAFKLLFKNSTYFLVDFPETLALAASFLSIVLPESKILFFHQWKNNPALLNSEEYDFVCVPNYAIGMLPSNRIHVALNTVSMQEMNYVTINKYFTELRRLLTGPRLFYQCNRDKLMDGMMIELKNYPYIATDTHLLQAPDPFYKYSIYIRKCFGRFPFLRRIRIPLVRKGNQIAFLTQMIK